MKVKVMNKQSEYLTVSSSIRDSCKGKLFIYFDEDMYISPESKFMDEFSNICLPSIYSICSTTHCLDIEHRLNKLLHHYRNKHQLFFYDELKKIEGLIHLKKEPDFFKLKL